VDLYDACIRRHRYKGAFEFTYVSTSNVIVKRLSTQSRIVLKSHFGYQVSGINIYRDRFLVAHTADTLLLGDLETCRLSEVNPKP
jgi:intraflagellar transport protein 172